MPKAEKGSVKDLAKKMKMKGLQKLKYYCQMCEKQCRDANGFKCHLTSESHLRQMKIFSDNAGGILSKYSKEFEQAYLSTLRMRHGTKKVNANNVYQELINDKQHIHMNATHWTTLTEFVQYLGKTSKCIVEEDERGWFVSYIERDASKLARQEAQQKREAADRAAEEAQAHRMELQRVEAAKALDRVGGSVNLEATSLERSEEDKPIKVELGTGTSTNSIAKKSMTLPAAAGFGDDDEDEDDFNQDGKQAPIKNDLIKGEFNAQLIQPANMKRKRQENSSLEGRHEEHTKLSKSEKSSSTQNDKYRKDYWLYRKIIVRVISKRLAGGKYFRRKAIVIKVIDKYTTEVEVLDSSPDVKDGGDILRLDQDDLETVVPKKDDHKAKVRILNGKYRGEKAIVEYLDKKAYHADLLLLYQDEKRIRKVPFEYFSLIA